MSTVPDPALCGYTVREALEALLEETQSNRDIQLPISADGRIQVVQAGVEVLARKRAAAAAAASAVAAASGSSSAVTFRLERSSGVVSVGVLDGSNNHVAWNFGPGSFKSIALRMEVVIT
jgi:hypothetical protein